MDDVRVLLDECAEPAELAAVKTVLERARIPGQVEGGYRKPKPGAAWGEGDEPECIVLIVVSSTFGAFFARFFGEAGADAWRGLKKFAEELRDSRRHSNTRSLPPTPPYLGAIHFRDQYDNVIEEPLYPEGPPDSFSRAWQEIDEPDWSHLDGSFVWWDDRQEAWAAFEPAIGSDRHVYWDRAASKWIEYRPDLMPVQRPSARSVQVPYRPRWGMWSPT